MCAGSVCRYRARSWSPTVVESDRTGRQALPITLENLPMNRPNGRPAVHPFRLTRATIEAHRDHLPTPMLGCPLCAVRTPVTPLRIRWTPPTPGLTTPRRSS